MLAVCHQLNTTCIREMKSYRVPFSKRLVAEGSSPSQTKRVVAGQALEDAKQEPSGSGKQGLHFANANPSSL